MNTFAHGPSTIWREVWGESLSRTPCPGRTQTSTEPGAGHGWSQPHSAAWTRGPVRRDGLMGTQGITPENLHHEIDTGPAMGNEAW